ncbi:hypothetical protein F1654_03530 [Alkalicaulis satelles]|uniref:DUF305 domain-containing protein n=1 Tax=Alkalicaulis satelles TaxID=2609175 RepID=A0A5M6ZNB0_9PROT|nr:hypothetical protein [Alkalicaulis satelles]KAA5805074.1 hypothetical protein F1654_03530 [Alkalicaulis satelles]
MRIRTALASSAAVIALALAGAAHAQQPRSFEPDVRTHLGAGLHDAEQAAWNLELEHAIAPPPGFFDPDALFSPRRFMEETRAAEEADEDDEEAPAGPRFTPLALANTDLAFAGGRVFVGNYNGFNVYDANGEGEPELVLSVVCPGGQGDVSVHGDLLFMSVEQNRGRLDCGTSGAEGDVNEERFRGVRIFDISDFSAPRQIAAVQTCRGSHTHTLLPHPADPDILYIYNSGTSFVRESDELDICTDGQPDENPETALYSIDVIKVPLSAPEEAAIINRPRIFADRESGDIAGLWRGGRFGVATQRTAQTNHCHDITVYPELGIAAGACSGNGILLDISDPENPARISDMFDPDMAYWHSATFNNTGDVVVFTDEWGGGVAARCQADDPTSWGANLIAAIEDGELKGRSFFKLPTVQGATENCVAHNGSLIPVPGRDLMVQSWYQGGVTIMDFTDPDNAFEIAYFDRGPVDEDHLIVGGPWSTYWYNGRIYSSEITRGLDVLRLLPSEHLSPSEIAAAERVREDQVNPQTQTRIVWEDHPDVARAYLDQLARSEALDNGLAGQVRAQVDRWEQGRANTRTLSRLARQLADYAAEAEGRDASRLSELSDLLSRVR